mgnify:CR=1 FL=1
MKFKMSERSLFAALLRAPWWVSFLVMLAVALVAGALLPDAYKTAGMLGAFPFFVIGVMAAWRQRNAISPSRIQELVEQARVMGWRDFSVLVEEALRQQGFVVTRLNEGPADFQIEKNDRVTLVSAKRWKAATHGIGPALALAILGTHSPSAKHRPPSPCAVRTKPPACARPRNGAPAFPWRMRA